MVRKFILVFSVMALSMLGLSTTAKADSLESFTYESNGNIFTWQLPASPVVDSSNVYPGFAFALNNVPVYENGGPAQMGSFLFFAAECAGGFDLSFGDNLVANTGWAQLYTGPESNPTFIGGTYSLTDDAFNTDGVPGTLTIPGTARMPEPSAFVLLCIGLLALAALFGSKRMIGAPVRS
jgi:hypothetical protein